MVISGPAGTGKSLACLWKLHYCAVKVPGIRALIVRKTRESLTESALVTFEMNVLPAENPSSPVSLGGGQRRMRQAYQYGNGSVIVIAGLDKPGKIMSTEFDLIYVQEAIELTEDAWESLTTRLRNGVLLYQQLLADTNPDRPTHWLKKRCDVGRTQIIESRHEDNPRLWDGTTWTEEGRVYLSKLDALTGPRKQRLRYGRWVQAEGVVWEEWDAAIHVIDSFPIPESWPRYWAVDFGYTDPFVCQFWAQDPEGRLHLYRELVQTHLLVEDAAALILQLSRNEPRPRFIVCDHDREGRETLTRHLNLDTDPAIKNMENGIQAVSLRLRKAHDGKPRLFAHRNALVSRDERMMDMKAPCGFIEEVDGWVWDIKDGRVKGEQPVDKDNHSLDSCRYLVEFLDEPTADLTLGIFDLAPKKEESMIHVRYPEIRHFPQSAKYQPQPVIRGQQILACPDFVTQEEAYWFVREMKKLLRLPPGDIQVMDLELKPDMLPDKQQEILDKQKEIRTKVQGMIAVHQLKVEAEEAVLPPPPEPAQAGGRRR